MFIIQCPILSYEKVCALPSAHSSLTCSDNQVRDSDPRDPKRERIVHLIEDFRTPGANGERILRRDTLGTTSPATCVRRETSSLTCSTRRVHGSGGAGPPAAQVDHQIQLLRPPPALRQEHPQTGAVRPPFTPSSTRLPLSLPTDRRIQSVFVVLLAAGSAGFRLPAHQMQNHPHRHQAGEHPPESGRAVRPEPGGRHQAVEAAGVPGERLHR